jgi:hypothetical protein
MSITHLASVRQSVSAAVLLLGLASLAGCGTTVVGGGGADEGGGGQAASSTGQGLGGSTSTSSTPEMLAMAITRAQLEVLLDTGYFTSGGGFDPDELFLKLSDIGVSCGEASVLLPCGFHWSVSISLPPALQAVGVYDLESPQITAGKSETSELHEDPIDAEDCAWGGGGLSGTLEILAIDDSTVHFRLTVSNSIAETDPSGEYVAPRCP